MSEEQNIQEENSKEQSPKSKKGNADEKTSQHFPGDSHALIPGITNQATENMETHAQHLHKAPGGGWKHYFFEFIMLFLAVFCGFLAENLREHYVEHQREKQYMHSLSKDLEQDVKNIEADSMNRKLRIQIADSLSEMLVSGDSDTKTNLIYFCARRLSVVGYVFHMTDGTLMQLKNSGGLRLIRKQNVVDSLQWYVNLYQRYSENSQLDLDQLRDYRNIMIHIFDARVFETMIKNFPIIAPPSGNPPLLINDRISINEFLMRTQLCKRISQVNTQYLTELKGNAVRLITEIKKEYHLK